MDSHKKKLINISLLIILAFTFGGAGLSILYNSNGSLVSVIGGFVLIGIAIAIIYNIVENG